MRRSLFLLYGLAAYALFLVSFLYAIGFVGNLLVPKSIDSGTPGGFVSSLLVNALLLALFALQHSGMARPAFKRWWTRFVPEPIERSTYVLLASSALLLLYALWRPMPQPLWDVRDRAVAAVPLWSLFAVGWTLVLLSTFMIGHFDLFGLKQVWTHLLGHIRPPDGFHAPAQRLRAALADRYADPERVQLRVVPGMGHALAAEPGVEPAPQTPEAATVDRYAVDWLHQHLHART